MRGMYRLALASAMLLATSTIATAQNTGGVFGPVVNEDRRAAEYRIGYRPSEDGLDDALAQRVHYEQAINGDLMWRVVAQAATNAQDNTDFDYVQGELFWELSDDQDWWKHGLRFDARLRDGTRPDQIGVNFTNEFAITENLRGRFVALTLKQFGENGADGVLFETRANLMYDTGFGPTIGVETYNTYGEMGDFLKLEDGVHQVGPFANIPIANGWYAMTGVLFGVTDASPDTNYRFWFGRAF